MRSSARRSVLVVLAGALTVVLALPASAAQLITYEGTTTQDGRARLRALKRDNGRRLVTRFSARLTITCEDSSTQTFAFGFARDRRLSDTGEFHYDFFETGSFFRYAFHVTGTVGFRSATGTVEFKYPSLNEAEEVQLCTSGVVDWSAERVRAEPARVQTGGSSPEGVTRQRIDRHGELVEIGTP